MPPIENVLEGRHFFVVGYSGVGTMRVANIIVEMDSHEYSMYFETIRMRVDVPDRKCTRGQALFRSWIFGSAHYQHS